MAQSQRKPDCAGCGHRWAKHSSGPRGGCGARQSHGTRIRHGVRVPVLRTCLCAGYITPEDD